MFDSYFNESIIKRARDKKVIDIKVHNLRDFMIDKHHSVDPAPLRDGLRQYKVSQRCGVDDSPYGGGPGMVLKIEPIQRAVQSIPNKKQKIKNFEKKIILFSTRGKLFNQKTAQRLAKYGQLILICGRYEGVDERVAKYIADEEISMGDFVLSGGELPAMMLIDAVARFIPGVLGKKESLETIKGSYPVYTRPEIVVLDKKKIRVPKVLLSGNHQKIEEWRKRFSGY